MFIFNTTRESIPYQSSNMQQARQCRRLNHYQSEGVGCGVHPFGSNCIYLYGYKKKPCRHRHNRTDIRIGLWHNHWKMKTFLLRETVTVTQVTLLTQTSQSGLTVQTVDLPAYNKQRHLTSIKTLLLSVFVHFFFGIIQLLEETNRYYHYYCDTLDEGWSPLSDMTVQDMCLLLAIIEQMGHNQRDMLKDYWSKLGRYLMAFYRNTMKRDRFCHILRFLHFSDNKNECDKTDENYVWLWKMGTIFDRLSDSYAKYYSLTKHLAVYETVYTKET